MKPSISGMTHECVEVDPILLGGLWTQQWSVNPLDPAVVSDNLANYEAARVASLWQAAHDKEYEAISGSAIGLIIIGVLQGKPKCAAVQNWIKALWSEYYARKASGSDNLDFSIAGECPHSVPELMSELNI